MAKTDSLLIAICGLALTIVAVALLFAKPPLTGAVVAVEFIEPLSITATKNANIDLNLDTNINSFKLTGNFTGQSFSIYLLFGEQKQKLLVVEGEGNISFLESCKETCEFSGEPSYALEIQIQNGTLWLDGYKYGKPELVSIEVAEKVEPEVLVEQNPSVIVLINEDADVEKLIDAGLKIKYDYEEFNAIAGTIAKNNLAKLAANPDIEAIKADAQYQITLNDSVPLIKAPQVWQIQVSGVNVTGDTETICIIDTGVNYSHPALATNYLGGVDFVNNDSDPMDDHNHGTHVAGIILSNDAFYRGVAPGAKFVAVKAFDSGGSGSLSNILAAMDWCVANKDTYNISVMSMSFGDGGQHNSDDCPTIFDSPINAAIAAGIIPVAASGNNGYANGVSSPACSPGVVAVGAVNDADSVASWSNSGALLDLLAPGVSIISTGKSGNFISMSGTSMATPHVSGVFALLQHYNKLKTGAALTPADAEAKLKSTGVIIIDPKNNLATPRVDAFAAITSSYIIIESPLNRTYGTGKLDFNITVDPSVYNAIFSIDAGANNTMTNDSATHWYNNSINELASGQHNATFYTFGDNINNSKTVFFSITTDTTPPQILLNSPANNSAVAIGRPINFTVIDDVQLQTVWYERNGTNTTIDSNNSIYLINTTTWTKGLQKITVYANDSAGNSNSSFFVFDADFAPIASNVTITPTNPTTNDNLVCNWVFSDPDNDAESNTVIKWFVNNAENSTFTNQTIINKSYTVKGQEWKCQVTPSDGLVFGTAVNSSAVVINNSPPLISTIYPNGGEKISGIITINASVSDADGQSDIQIVKFYYSNNSGSTFTLIGNDTIPSGGLYELTWNTSKVLDGKSYRIKIEAFDNSSATVAKISASNFAVNNVNEAPVVTVIAPNGGEVWNGSKSIKWNATDPDDDTLTIDIYYKNSSDANWAIIKAEEFNTGSYTWNTTSVPDGSTYLINVTAQDPGGYVVSDVSDNTFTIKNAVSGNNSSPGAGAAIPLIPTTPTNVTSAPLAEAIQEPLVNEAEQFFVSITPFAPAKFAPGLTGLAVSEITLKSKVNAESITAKIRKLESAPISIEDGEVYQYFELITEGLSARDLDKIIIKFKVPKSWADAHSTVYLATLVGTGWQKLPTTKTEEDSTTIEYLATTSHLSTFAIVGSTKTTVFAKIEVLYAIIGTLAGIIICVLFVLTSKRRRSKGSKPKMQLQQSHWPLVRPKEPKKPQSPYPKEVPDFGFC